MSLEWLILGCWDGRISVEDPGGALVPGAPRVGERLETHMQVREWQN